jgi:hypothetical protein
MKLIIPKDMRGTSFSPVSPIEFNNFDVDRLLPTLFFKILGGGRGRAPRKNDPTAIQSFVDQLAEHPDLKNFNNDDGRRVLNRLVRTTLISMGSVGERRRGEQILSVTPYNILCHKPGFPTESSRLRGVDTFIYRAMRDSLGADNALQNFVKMVFGKGVRIGPISTLGGEYDGSEDLDILSRLSIAFLDGFEPVGVGRGIDRTVKSPCAGLVRVFAEDLLRYLFAYYNRMPSQALTYYFLGLINFELFNYSLKLVYSVNALVRQPDTLPPAMQHTGLASPPHIYLDFTSESGSLSQEMATECVRRDIESYQRFLHSTLLLRQLDRYVVMLRRNSKYRANLEQVLNADTAGADYLQGLLRLQDNPEIDVRIQALAQNDETKIREANLDQKTSDISVEATETDEELPFLRELDNMAGTDVERVVALLVEGQRQKALPNYLVWFRDSGGLMKSHGVLEGNLRGRRSWRYAPGNDFLAILVQLAVVRDGTCSGENGHAKPDVIKLQDFLTFLEERFGILIDRPPAPFHGADYAAAARDNLRAMLKRLRQMGIFRDLSDDFTVQRIYPPYVDERTVTTESNS